MYRFVENFDRCNDCALSYSISEENLHPYGAPSARIEDLGLVFLRRGARFLLNTPNLESFSLSVGFSFKEDTDKLGDRGNFEIYFGYSPALRDGKMLSVGFGGSKVTLSLFEVRGKARKPLSEQIFENTELCSNEVYTLLLNTDGKLLSGSFLGHDFSFRCESCAGRIGFSCSHTVNLPVFSSFIVECPNLISESEQRQEYVIPYYDGGSENYSIALTLKRYSGGACEISCELTGGARSRKTEDYKMSVWSVQYDVITNPYIRFYSKNPSEKMYLKNGNLTFVEQNEKITFTNLAMRGEDLPFKASFYLENLSENLDFAFGYDMFRRLGNELQEGKREYIYRDGVLIYSGEPLASDFVITIESPKDKKIASFIPKDIDLYENALLHARENHYFLYDEDAEFRITSFLRKSNELLSMKVTLLDAFFDEIRAVDFLQSECDRFSEYGQFGACYNVNLGKMAQGVYHLRAELCLGEEILASHTSAFEVLDGSEISPRESSGIPFMYSGEATPPNVEFNCPDPWLTKPDHNEVHYLDCMLGVPEIVENRRGWELLSLYKRKLFMWIDHRTRIRGKTHLDYPNSIKYADYLKIGDPPRFAVFPSIFKQADILKIYRDFQKEHPDYDLPYVSDEGDISNDGFVLFYRRYGSEWTNYLALKNGYNLIEFHEELKKLNPNLKFVQYGTYGHYGTKLSGPKSSVIRMFPTSLAGKIMDGFWIFEDYPFITGQRTHYSAWGIMGTMISMPDANFALELFSSFDPVCPDGAVYFAFPPLGEVYAESYRTATQLYEAMYAPVFSDGRFRYYDNPRFQFLQIYNTEATRRFEEFLKSFGTYRKNKPKMPMRCAAFICEYADSDDRFNLDFSWRDANNISQAGLALLYEILANSGLPKGFCTDFSGLLTLSADECDVCVVPSLSGRGSDVLSKIRELAKSGVALIAVSDISGTEKLFGVKRSKRRARICRLENGDGSEIIARRDAEFFYECDGAEVLLYALTEDGEKIPYIMKYGKNILINGYVCELGCAEFVEDSFGVANVSVLTREVVSRALFEVSEPLATADNSCGISLFTGEDGERRILLTEYSLCGEKEGKTVTVRLNFEASDVECVLHPEMTVVPRKIMKDGRLLAFRVQLRAGESAIFKLI